MKIYLKIYEIYVLIDQKSSLTVVVTIYFHCVGKISTKNLTKMNKWWQWNFENVNDEILIYGWTISLRFPSCMLCSSSLCKGPQENDSLKASFSTYIAKELYISLLLRFCTKLDLCAVLVYIHVSQPFYPSSWPSFIFNGIHYVVWH